MCFSIYVTVFLWEKEPALGPDCSQYHYDFIIVLVLETRNLVFYQLVVQVIQWERSRLCAGQRKPAGCRKSPLPRAGREKAERVSSTKGVFFLLVHLSP